MCIYVYTAPTLAGFMTSIGKVRGTASPSAEIISSMMVLLVSNLTLAMPSNALPMCGCTSVGSLDPNNNNYNYNYTYTYNYNYNYNINNNNNYYY